MDIPSAETSINKMVAAIHGMQHAPVEAAIGLVLKLPPDIQIAYDNIVLEKKDLYIDAFLLKNYARTGKGQMQQTDEKGNIDIPTGKGDIKTSSQSKRGGAGKPSFVSHFHKEYR